MTRTSKPLLAALLVAIAASTAVADDSTAADKAANACVEVSSNAEYENLGYTHFVHLNNTCKKALTCSVTTSATPEPLVVDVGPEEKHSVVTFRGSPAREFTASAKCKRK